MEKDLITLFKDFKKVVKNISLNELYEMTKSGAVRPQVENIRRYEAEHNSEMTASLKKALPAVTVAAVFNGGRTKDYFSCLSGLTVLDFDELNEKLNDVKAIVISDKHTLMANISPRGNGLKVIVRIQPENTELPTSWEEADRFYRTAYTYVVDYYSQLCHCEVDTSGKDITRLNFLSYDADAFLNQEAIPFIVPIELNAKENKEEATADKKTKENKQKSVGEKNLETLLDTKASDDRLQALFKITCKNLYSEGDNYKRGNRNNFVYKAVHTLNDYGIPKATAGKMVNTAMPMLCSIELIDDEQKEETEEPLTKSEVDAILKSVYENNSDTFGKSKIGKVVMNRINMQVELTRHYIMRRNVLAKRIEYILRRDYNEGSRKFKEMEDGIINHICGRLQEQDHDIPCSQVHMLVNSPFTPAFDPVRDYFDHLPEWDGKDYLAEWTHSLRTNDDSRFENVMKMFYVGMFVAYFNDSKVNHIVPVLYSGSQGGGKTWFWDNMLPPELKAHRYNGKIHDDKDSLSYVATKLLICVDEMNHLDRKEMQEMKDLVTRDSVDMRLAYERFSHKFPHIASFVGTCNDTNFMNDPSGNRRWHVFEVHDVDMDYVPNYPQLFAQVKYLMNSCFKYYIDKNEQEELAAYAYQFEHNSDEFEYMMRYVRKYPPHCQKKQEHTVSDILNCFQRYQSDYIIDRPAKSRLAKALARKGYEYHNKHNVNHYTCHLLTAEQWGYIDKYRNPNVLIDLEFDKFVPREILIAGDNAVISDICKAKEILNSVDGDFEKAQRLYDKYIADDKDLSFLNKGNSLTNENTLPF